MFVDKCFCKPRSFRVEISIWRRHIFDSRVAGCTRLSWETHGQVNNETTELWRLSARLGAGKMIAEADFPQVPTLRIAVHQPRISPRTVPSITVAKQNRHTKHRHPKKTCSLRYCRVLKYYLSFAMASLRAV